MKTYAKDGHGLVHLKSMINSEFTLCGNAFDGDADTKKGNDPFSWRDVKPQPITCTSCAAEIISCRKASVTLSEGTQIDAMHAYFL